MIHAQEAKTRLQGKRILILQQSLELGGAERSGILLARHLKDVERADVVFGGLAHPDGLAARLCSTYGIPCEIVPCEWRGSRRRRVWNLLRFARRLRLLRPEVLLPYTSPPNVFCGSLWRWSGAKVCIWNQQDEGRQRFPRLLESAATKRTSHFVSNSTAGVDFLRNVLRVSADRVSFVHNGVELGKQVEDRNTWRKKLGLGEDVPVAGMVANLHHFKDHETLLRAWRQVVSCSKTHPSPVLLLAGRGCGLEDRLKAICFDLHLVDLVKFIGVVEDIPGLISTLDLCVHSSRHEGCPNAVQECMATGLAVAGTDIPGMRDALGDQGLEFLAPVRDHAALAERILRLLENPSLRRTVGHANRVRIEQEFRPEQMCCRMVDIIVDCMSQRNTKFLGVN